MVKVHNPIVVELVGGPANGEFVFCLDTSSVLSVPRLGNGWAAYVKRPDGKFQYACMETKPTGEEVE